MRTKTIWMVGTAATAWVLAPSLAWAQAKSVDGPATTAQASTASTSTAVPSQAEPDQASPTGELADIVVTAQRRAQTLERVPVAVSVLGGDALAAAKITSIQGLGAAVPNLVVTQTPFQPFVAIRGLGSSGGSRALEQSVATYVDGIYAGRANQFLNPFFDVERVEVVRGPQGVLFGINANAGAINIVNKRAGKTFEGYAAAGYEAAYQGYSFEGGVSLPISPTLGLRVAGKIGKDGGWLDNQSTGDEEPRSNYSIARGILSWTPVEGLRADLGYEHSFKRVRGTPFEATYVPPGIFPPALETGNVDFKKTAPGTPEFTRIKNDNITLNLAYDVGGHTLTSSTGYSTFGFSQQANAGAVPVFFGNVGAEERYKQFYQELRLASATGNLIDYIVGATYYRQTDRLFQGIDADLSIFGATGVRSAVRNDLDQTSRAFSFFGQGTFNVRDNLHLVGGLRYTNVRKSALYTISAAGFGAPLRGYAFDPVSAIINPNLGWMLYVNPSNPATVRPSVYDRSRTFEALNPAATLNWEITSRISGYASFTTGTKAGGFNDQEKTGVAPENGFPTDDFSFNKESTRNYEIGAKANLGRIRMNAAVFHAVYSDLQVSQVIPNSVRTGNAGAAKATGAEFYVQALVARGLTVSGDLAYIDAKYGDFVGAGCIARLTPDPTCNPLTANARGGRLEGVPKWTGSANAEYRTLLSADWELRLRGRAYYNDGAQFGPDQDPLDRVPSYWLFDAGIEVGQVAKGWSLSVSGRNLANDAIRTYSQDSAVPLLGHQSVIAPGRQVFLDLRYSF